MNFTKFILNTQYLFKSSIQRSILHDISSINSIQKSFTQRSISTINSKLNQRIHSGDLEDLNELSEKKKIFFNKFENLIEKTDKHRNFAVIHMYGYQHLVHEGDVIQIKKDIPAKLGERIKIEKCLMAGNDYLTLIGRPVLDRNKVNVEVTPIEKTQSHTINNHLITKRSQGRRKHRYLRYPITFIRINEIKINKN